jgi:hypothetical protein
MKSQLVSCYTCQICDIEGHALCAPDSVRLRLSLSALQRSVVHDFRADAQQLPIHLFPP